MLEKSDFVAIVAPGCLHADRRDPNTKLRTKACYRPYRRRGWCVLEMFASYLSRDHDPPMEREVRAISECEKDTGGAQGDQ